MKNYFQVDKFKTTHGAVLKILYDELHLLMNIINFNSYITSH